MSGFIPFAAAGGAPINPNFNYELDDLIPDAVAVVSGGGAHVQGNFVSLGDVDADASGFILEVGGVGTATMRCQWSVRKNGGIILPDLHINPGTNSWNRISLPLGLTIGDTVEIALRCQAASQNMRANMLPFSAASGAYPGLAAAAGINVSSGGTFPHASPVGNDNTWVELTSAGGIAADAKGFITTACNDSVPAVAQRSVLCIGVGAPGSEVEIYRTTLNMITSSPYLASAVSPFIRHHLSAGNRVHAKIIAGGTVNSDTCRVGVWTFS